MRSVPLACSRSPTLPPCFKASLEYKPLIKGASYKEWRDFVVLSFELNDCANLEPYIYIYIYLFLFLKALAIIQVLLLLLKSFRVFYTGHAFREHY